MNSSEPVCTICQKHRRKRPDTVIDEGLVYAGHADPDGGGSAYLGYLIIEPKRHVRELSDLTEEEACAMAVASVRLSKALTRSESAEHVYAFLLGDKASHLHLHLVPRYPGTPREYYGVQVDEWPGAPRGGKEEIAAICARLRQALLKT